MDRGPRIEVTVGVSLSDLEFVGGVGLKLVGLAFQIAGLLDWLADLFFHQFDRVILRTLVP